MAASSVERALMETGYLGNISVGLLKIHPEVLSMFRKSACPSVAGDRLVGLAGVSASLFKNMEDAEKPYVSPRMPAQRLSEELSRIAYILNKWLIRIYLFGCRKSAGQPSRKYSVLRQLFRIDCAEQ